MSAVQNDTLKINHCVNRAAPVSIYRDWPASLSFARLKNKHIGVLRTNVATMSWLHWSPVLGILIYTLAFSNVLLVLALNFMVHKSSCCKCSLAWCQVRTFLLFTIWTHPLQMREYPLRYAGTDRIKKSHYSKNILFWIILFFPTLQSTCIFRRHVGEDVNIP